MQGTDRLKAKHEVHNCYHYCFQVEDAQKLQQWVQQYKAEIGRLRNVQTIREMTEMYFRLYLCYFTKES